MRASIVCLAALAVGACTPAPSRTRSTSYMPTLDVRTPGHVRVYTQGMPRCPVRDVGTVAGLTYEDLQTQAFRLRANAVILETGSAYSNSGHSGLAVQFIRSDCQE
jgi:hypothetical protein